MSAWIVAEGEVTPYAVESLPPRERYGWDWIYVEAADGAAALAIAEQYDAAQDLSALTFATAYREGALSLPGDALVSVTEIAAQLGTTPGMVHQWRRRDVRFPAPAETLAIGPVWWWSDVARWSRVVRPSGRPPSTRT